MGLIEAVHNLLNSSDCPASVTLEQCASELAMSMTSFRRKLSQEETSYKLIHAKFLNELCVHALLTNQTNIDELAIKLGYSERATFERSFRQKFGITPSQFRELSLVSSHHESYQKLTHIAQHIPPMSDSCRLLLQEKESGALDINRTTDIISKDPIFSARVMGQASKAIYGKTPSNIQEAISRNLGVNTVINFAVVYAVKDALQEHVQQAVIDQYSKAFLVAPLLFKLVRRSLNNKVKFDNVQTEQVLVFALLGVFLLSHKNAHKYQLMLHSLQGIEELTSLNAHIQESMGISIFSSSALMLSLWHIDAGVVKQLNHLDKVSRNKAKGAIQDEMLLFMLSCLYCFAAGHTDYDHLFQKAELLSVDNFDEIKALLFT